MKIVQSAAKLLGKEERSTTMALSASTLRVEHSVGTRNGDNNLWEIGDTQNG